MMFINIWQPLHAGIAIIALAAVFLLTGCAALSDYNSHVAAREDSLSGYAKDSGSYGGQFTHRVEYRQTPAPAPSNADARALVVEALDRLIWKSVPIDADPAPLAQKWCEELAKIGLLVTWENDHFQ